MVSSIPNIDNLQAVIQFQVTILITIHDVTYRWDSNWYDDSRS